MYAPGPSTKELEAFGLLAEDVVDDTEVEVWPDNWEAVRVFSMLSTQWRIAQGGPTGLDYKVIPDVMDLAGVRKKSRGPLFNDIRHMEAAALTAMCESNRD